MEVMKKYVQILRFGHARILGGYRISISNGINITIK